MPNDVTATPIPTFPVALASEVTQWRERIEGYVITMPELREAASDDLARLKTVRKDLEEARLGIVRSYRDLSDRDTAPFRAPIAIADAAIERIERLCLGWDRELQRKADEARRQAEAEAAAARRRAELAAAEANRKAEAEAAAARKAQEAAQAAQASMSAAIEQGDTDKAVEAAQVAVQAEAEVVAHAAAATAAQQVGAVEMMHTFDMPLTVAPAPPKFAGESKRETWSAEVDNFLELVKAVADGRASIALLEVNQTALNGMARSLKREFNVPGCRAVATEGLATRRKA